MEENKETMGMVDLMIRPVFCVKDQKIVKVNPAARGVQLSEGMEIAPLLLTGREEYSSFSDGCLYLMLTIGGARLGASVTKVEGMDVFVLEQDADQAELQAMALAARELREPLSSVMITAGQLFPMTALQQDEKTRQQVARLNRGLYQMLRILGNMSDAGRSQCNSRQELLEITGFFAEVFEKARALLEHTGLALTYRGPDREVYSMADPEQLERAVLNILSNAIKFTPRGGTIEASLTQSGQFLRLSIQDSGCGIQPSVRGSVFERYLRQPALEDSRFGIGLGMVIIRAAATNHGGAVLIDHPEEAGTRITMTLAIRRNGDTQLRSPVMRIDYAGERDHALLELSGCLPPELYE